MITHREIGIGRAFYIDTVVGCDDVVSVLVFVLDVARSQCRVTLPVLVDRIVGNFFPRLEQAVRLVQQP